MRNNVTQSCVTESVTERNESVTVTQDVTKERKQEERSKEEIKKETQDSENRDASVALYNNAPSAARAPTREEVLKYINTLNSGLDADAFYNHYESLNWSHNGEKLVDWKAMARKWAAVRPQKENAAQGNFDTDEMFRRAVERGMALVNHS